MCAQRESWQGRDYWWSRENWHSQENDSAWGGNSWDSWGGWRSSNWQDSNWQQDGRSWRYQGDDWKSTAWQSRHWDAKSASSSARARSAPPLKECWEDESKDSRNGGDAAAGPVRRRSSEQQSWPPAEASIADVPTRTPQSRVWRPGAHDSLVQAENKDMDKEATLSKLVDIVHTMMFQHSKSYPLRGQRGSFSRCGSRRQSWASNGGCLVDVGSSQTERPSPKVKEVPAAMSEKKSRSSCSSLPEKDLMSCPPSSDSWDWPLSRSETWARVQLIDKKMHFMDRQELEKELEELKGVA